MWVTGRLDGNERAMAASVIDCVTAESLPDTNVSDRRLGLDSFCLGKILDSDECIFCQKNSSEISPDKNL